MKRRRKKKKSEGVRLNHSMMMMNRAFPHLDAAAAHQIHDRLQLLLLLLLVDDAKAGECVMTMGGAMKMKKMMTKVMISERETADW
jgi:hypothetical protein